MYLVNYGVNLERTFSPSAEVSSSLLLCSFLSSPILVCRKMGGTWEELGLNNPHVRTGFFEKRCPSPIFKDKVTHFFSSAKVCPESWLLLS